MNDRAQFEPVRAGLAIARELRRLYPHQWEFEKVDRLLVHPEALRAIDAGLSLAAIVDTYRLELAAFIRPSARSTFYGTRDCSPPDAGSTRTRS